MDWRGTVEAPVLTHWSCCSLVLCHQCQYASWFIHMLPCYHDHIDGLAWNCVSSSADTLEFTAVLRYAISVSTRVVLYVCCHVTIVILVAWSGIVVAPVLMHWRCCSLALCHQCQYASCSIYMFYIAMVILMNWRGTVVASVLTHWSCCSLALCHQCQYASCFIHMLPCYHGHIDGLAWDCGSSSADALELQQSFAVPSVSVRKLFYTYVVMLPWSYWWLGVELW